MKANLAHLGLAIENPLVHKDAPNYRPKTWPPNDEFPIVINSSGDVVSRYGDSIWDLRVWAKGPIILNFGDGHPSKLTPRLSHENARLLRKIVAWWLYGLNAVHSPRTLRDRFYKVRKLFAFCSQQGIVASDLCRFPRVIDEFRNSLPTSVFSHTLLIFHFLYEDRDNLGFVILDRKELARMEAAMPDHEVRQTPYIPPRIWLYQVNRLRSFLDDFINHKDKIIDCFNFCIDAYTKNFGSLAAACQTGHNRTWGPFWVQDGYSGLRSGKIYHGSFGETAKRFGIDELLSRWVMEFYGGSDLDGISIRSFSTYFSMASYVGLAYLLNFSLMRVDEGRSLRVNCLKIENDDRFGALYLLCGPTSKTIDDDDAVWPTSPSVKTAIDVMACVASLRMVCAEANPEVPVTAEDIENPYLIVRAYEPWGNGNADDLSQSPSIKSSSISYTRLFTEAYPKLFDYEELRIVESDLKVARLVTPTLDGEKYSIGAIWPLAWHQLRRTGAVNMQASGLVSDPSLQYLLKHSSRTMSLYYGQGYSRVRLNKEAQTTYIRAMYESLGKILANLFSDRFVSPHGDRRKSEILKLIDLKDSKKLTKLAKAGKVSWRETLLGGCTKRGACPYGGVDNIAHCGGGDGGPPCADVLFDRERSHELSKLACVIRTRLLDAPQGSPFQESLKAQLRSVENALNAIR